jgi:hypothetical protein
MSTQIMYLNLLEVGKSYKIVTNAGYFSKICRHSGFSGEFACFIDEQGGQHTVHTMHLWSDDNPVRIYTI